MIIRSSLSPALRRRTLPASSLKTHQKSILIFDRFLEPKLGQNGSKLDAQILPKSIQNLIDVLIDFWMRFWSQNDAQNHQQLFKNLSRTESDLKNVIFSKIAPRYHESSIFEGPGCRKQYQNWAKTVQEPLKNPIEILIEFWIVFSLILALFWLPKMVQNGSKSNPKNVSKNQLKNHWKMEPTWFQKWSRTTDTAADVDGYRAWVGPGLRLGTQK